MHRTGEIEFSVWITFPEGTSHNLRLESREEDMMFLPKSMIVVEVTERVCPRNTRTGCTLIPKVDVSEEVDDQVSGNSAERIDKLKSAPEESNTREEGKNCRWVILDTFGFAVSLRLLEVLILCGGEVGEIGWIEREPSRCPIANRDLSGEMSKAVIRRGYRVKNVTN